MKLCSIDSSIDLPANSSSDVPHLAAATWRRVTWYGISMQLVAIDLGSRGDVDNREAIFGELARLALSRFA